MRFLVPLLLVAAACGTPDRPPAEVVQIDWAPRIAATRSIDPVSVELLVQVEVNEVFEAGHLLSGIIDVERRLADLTNSSPTTSNPRNRIVVNGADAYLLTAIDTVATRLPEGADIVHGSVEDFAELGVVSLDPEVLTGALGLLGGATETRQVDTSVFEVDLDVAAALAGLSASERRAVPFELAGIDETVGLAEVTLSADGSTINRLRIRVNGSGGAGGAGEVLLTVDYRIEAFTDPITFSEPPAGQLAELSDLPDLRSPIAELGPGF